jgi:hypothetical protein
MLALLVPGVGMGGGAAAAAPADPVMLLGFFLTYENTRDLTLSYENELKVTLKA